MRNPLNLHEEISAMAVTGVSSPLVTTETIKTEEQPTVAEQPLEQVLATPRNKKNRDKLVQEFRISVSYLPHSSRSTPKSTNSLAATL